MTVTVHLPDELAERLAAVAARRGVDVDQIATEMVTAGLGAEATRPRRRLSFADVGASNTGQTSDDIDQMLAEGFGQA